MEFFLVILILVVCFLIKAFSRNEKLRVGTSYVIGGLGGYAIGSTLSALVIAGAYYSNHSSAWLLPSVVIGITLTWGGLIAGLVIAHLIEKNKMKNTQDRPAQSEQDPQGR